MEEEDDMDIDELLALAGWEEGGAPQPDSRKLGDHDKDEAPRVKKKEVKYYNGARTTDPGLWEVYQKVRLIEAFKEIYANDYIGKKGHRYPVIMNDELVEKIAERVPYRTFKEVKDFISTYTNKALQEVIEKNPVALDKWLELVEALAPDHLDLCRQLGNIMKVVQEEPVVPEMEDPSLPVPDYNKLYEYLHCAITNKELPALSPIESLIMEDCMQSLVHEIECFEDPRLAESLRKVYLHLTKKDDQYQEDDYKVMRKNMLHNANVFNPLGINYKAVVPSTFGDADR